MELLSVGLKNVRSFKEARIPFGPGIVRITGENGAGKSTILASVAYAVLGTDAIDRTKYIVDKEHIELDSATKLLRRGEAWGLVEVVFRTAQAPGRRFRLHRVLGKRPKLGRRSAAKPTDASEIIEREDAALVELGPDGAVIARLDGLHDGVKRTILAAVAGLLDLTGDALAHAFKRIVAAPQGRLLQAVFEENKARRDIAWQILGVDRYARAAEDATRVGGLLEKRYAGLMAKAVAAAEQEVKGLEDAPELVTKGEADEALGLSLVAKARARRVEAMLGREHLGEALARVRERSAEGARVLAERDAIVRETEDAEKAERAALAAAKRREALAPEAARHEALLALRPGIEARVLAHARLRSALEAARTRADEHARRDAADALAQDRRLAEAEVARARYSLELDGLTARDAGLEAAAVRLDATARTARAGSDAFVAWLARVKPALSRLTDTKASGKTKIDPDALDALARTAPRGDRREDEAVVARAREVEEAERRASRAEAEARGVLMGWRDLDGRVGAGGHCPFLVVPCPHERGKNLRGVVQENARSAEGALAAAEAALAAAVAGRAALEAARRRVEAGRVDREAWQAQAARLAPAALAWVEAWDRERASLSEAGRDPGADAALGAFESAIVPSFAVPAAWDAPGVAALVAAVRARREALALLPPGVEARLEARRVLSEKAAADAGSAREHAALERASVAALRREGPARLAALEKEIATQAAARAAFAVRSADEAKGRAADLEGLVASLAAQGDVPGESARFRQDLDLAQRAKDELNRLEGTARAGEAARERLEALGGRRSDLAGRALGLESAALADADAPLPAPVISSASGLAELAREPLERLAKALATVAAGFGGRVAEASRLELESEAALRAAESALSVTRDRLGEARRRAEALLGKRAALAKLREASDHVAHACSVLRGGGGEGRFAGSLYRALVELPGRLADRRVREVSGHARRIYRALAPADTWDLVWDPRTYVLALGAPGADPGLAVREGIAVEDMSGGQQMSAALALHLALVHTYARNCDLLFLDEPTTHLDAKRRRALAECLRSLRARVEGLVPLRQVIVISHDEAFDALHDHVIRVVAGAGDEPSHIEDGTIRAPAPSPSGLGASIEAAARLAAAARPRPRRRAPAQAESPEPKASPQLLMAFGDGSPDDTVR
jgi:exonuclease SbcC